MGWDVIPLATSVPWRNRVGPLVCSITRLKQPGVPPSLVLLFRTSLCALIPWIVRNARVQVELGTDADRGMLRITPKEQGPHMFTLRGPQKYQSAFGLVLRGLESCPVSVTATQVPCDFDYNDTATPPWLLVTIPVAIRPVLWKPLTPSVGGIGPLMDLDRDRLRKAGLR